jgi:hypothetical protein
VKDEKNLESTSSVLLSSQVEEAKKQLTDLRLQEILGSELITNLADPQGSQLRYSVIIGSGYHLWATCTWDTELL